MRAAVFHGKTDVRIEDVGEPSVGPGMVKLRNGYAGICGTDLHVYYAPESSGMDFTTPHPRTGSMAPVVLGHEASGTVLEIGDGVEGLAPGDNVAVWPVFQCNECVACKKGLPNACVNIAFFGLTYPSGGHAEFSVVPAEKLHKLPPNVDLKLGALVEPMAVAWHAVDLSEIKAGGTALVSGAGPIGIGVWFALKARGVETIIVSEPSAERRAAIAGIGAEIVVDPVSEDLAAAVSEHTAGRGVDAAFDAAGAKAAFDAALESLTPGGALVLIALPEGDIPFNPASLVWKETKMIAAFCHNGEVFDAVIDAMGKGFYRMDGWVETVGLDDLTGSYERLREGKAMKLLVDSQS